MLSQEVRGRAQNWTKTPISRQWPESQNSPFNQKPPKWKWRHSDSHLKKPTTRKGAVFCPSPGCAPSAQSLAGELCDLRVTSGLVLMGSIVSLLTPDILFYNITTQCQRVEQSVGFHSSMPPQNFRQLCALPGASAICGSWVFWFMRNNNNQKKTKKTHEQLHLV